MQDAFFRSESLAASESADYLDLLAAKCAAGDRESFDAIYTATVNEVFRYLRSQCGNETIAEDLAANVFLKAWKSAAAYRAGSRSYRRWLFAIARNELVDYWRQARHSIPFEGFDIADETSSGAFDASGVERGLVLRALLALTPEQREVVVLRYFSELSHAEIGRVLGKREGAVRAQLLRALRQMRKVMNNAAP